VLLPQIAARIEEKRDLTGRGIDRAQVAAFAAIAQAARIREIIERSFAAVLASDDVIEMVRRESGVFWDLTVFAAAAGALCYFLAEDSRVVTHSRTKYEAWISRWLSPA